MNEEPTSGPPRDEQANTKETLVPDLRPQLRTAQLLEEKLMRLLKKASLPVSCQQTARLLRPR